jgi:hypothetical protein
VARGGAPTWGPPEAHRQLAIAYFSSMNG